MPTGVLHLKEVDTDEITLDGTLSVSGASTLEGATVAHSTLSVGGAAILADASATNVNVSGTLSVAGQTTMGGDIIPDTNDAYDIGSPEFKIRDLYVSNNSIWVGDDMKISNVNGSLKFRKRKTDVVPKAILDAGANAGHANEQATADAALAHAGIGDIGSMKLQHWFKFMRTLNAAARLTDIFRDDNDDYEESSASDAWKEIANTNKIYTNSLVGVGTSDPDDTLHVKGSFKVESETGFKLIRSSVGGTDPTVIIDTQNFGTDETVNDLTGRGDAKYTKLYRVYGRNSEGVGRSWYWGYANDNYTNFSLAFDGGGLPDPDIAFTFTTASELHCNKVYAALGGNADTATRLQTPRKINGVDFDGTQDITLSTEASKLATPVNINGVSFDGSSDIQINKIDTGSSAQILPFNKVAGDAPLTEFNYVLNAPRPGTTHGGAVHFINGTGRTDDGGASTYTIRNDSGDLRLGKAGFTTRIEGTVEFANTPTGLSSGLNMAQSVDAPFKHKNHPYGKWLYIGGWSSDNTDDISRIRTSNGNLHLDAAAGHTMALNYYNTSATIICGSKLEVNGTSQFNGEMRWGLGHTSHAGYSTNKDWYIRSGSSSGKVIIQDTGGNVGIGTASPSAKLDVHGGGLRVSGYELTSYQYPSINSGLYPGPGYGGTKPIAPFNTNFSAYFTGMTRAPGYVAFSDQRIKSNIVDISDTTALDQLRQLQPKYYEYVDKVGRGSSTVIGFIAQEVKEVVPQAVSVANGDIPNIYQTANVSANTITFTNFHTSNLDATSNTLVVYEEGTKRKELTITEVIDEHTIRVDTEVSGEDVLVYGQVVQDFHHLNKDYLWTVATSALQEVDRQLQAEKARNDRLEARLQALETALAIS